MKCEFIYNAYVTSVYDGDTITVDIDLGFGIFLKNQKIRLSGIDAPEIRGNSKLKGIESRDFLKKLINETAIIVKTYKDAKEKFGRILAEVYLKEGSVSINQQLLNEGFAVRYTP